MQKTKQTIFLLFFSAIMANFNPLFADILPTFKLWNRWNAQIWFKYENNNQQSDWKQLLPNKSDSTSQIDTKSTTRLFISKTDPETPHTIYRYDIPEGTNIYVYFSGLPTQTNTMGQEIIPLYKEINKLALGLLASKKNLPFTELNPAAIERKKKVTFTEKKEVLYFEPMSKPQLEVAAKSGPTGSKKPAIQLGKQRIPETIPSAPMLTPTNPPEQPQTPSVIPPTKEIAPKSTQEQAKPAQQTVATFFLKKIQYPALSPEQIRNWSGMEIDVSTQIQPKNQQENGNILTLSPYDIFNINQFATNSFIFSQYNKLKNEIENGNFSAQEKKTMINVIKKAITLMINPYLNINPTIYDRITKNSAILEQFIKSSIMYPDNKSITIAKTTNNEIIETKSNNEITTIIISPYAILGIAPSATNEEITKAYDTLRTQWIQTGNPVLSGKVFDILKTAKEVIEK